MAMWTHLSARAASSMTDIAVWRSGIFYIKQSATSQSSAQQFGAAGDVPVAAAFVQ